MKRLEEKEEKQKVLKRFAGKATYRKMDLTPIGIPLGKQRKQIGSWPGPRLVPIRERFIVSGLTETKIGIVSTNILLHQLFSSSYFAFCVWAFALFYSHSFLFHFLSISYFGLFQFLLFHFLFILTGIKFRLRLRAGRGSVGRAENGASISRPHILFRFPPFYSRPSLPRANQRQTSPSIYSQLLWYTIENLASNLSFE